MIDDGIGPSWHEALQPDNRSLRYMDTKALQAPFAIEHVARWHGCTLAEARDRIGAELLRRTSTTDFGKQGTKHGQSN